MEDKSEPHYLHALEVAWEKLLPLEHLIIAKNAGIEFDGVKKEFIVPWLNELYSVNLKKKTVLTGGNEPAGTLMSLVILRYLLGAKDIGLTNKLISFMDLHGGNIYYGVFERSVLRPVIKKIASQPEKLVQIADLFGGRKLSYGDASVEIKIFPRLPITIIVWKGDEEIPGSANVVFDDSAKSMLSAEELCVISVLAVSRLVKSLNTIVKA